ncbi:MAG: tyrosine-type recombinase/integrase [Paraglaciecola polaris]|uniref:tyrosine-type recombinase/integrase n=1 Tax=Paraglaciecola polaris TaxID=222814 RepID=UPI0030026163|tara:strand:- start:4895 stop:6703 length:1809 start_codon:yes stop_codon:yes gene_type:complete
MGFSFLPHNFATKEQRMQARYTYLYRVKNSKNYFFRVRHGVFQKFCHYTSSGKHFVASLKTSELDEAIWLCQFIFKKLKEETKMYYSNKDPLSTSVSVRQADGVSNIGALINFDEEILKLELHTFLKEKFNKWLNLGKKMLQLGVIDAQQLQNLRTISPEIMASHYSNNVDAERHPTPNSSSLNNLVSQAASLNVDVDPWPAEAKMMNRLIAELSKLGREYDNYSPDLIAEKPQAEIVKDMEFLNLYSSLKDFTAFGRRVERNNKIEKNKNNLLKTCIDDFCSSKFREVGASSQQQYRKSFEVMVSVLGEDFLVSELDPEQAKKVKHAILKLPSGRLQDGIEQKLSVKSVNKYLANLFTFCKWLVGTRKLLSSNPFDGSALKLGTKNQKHRRKFQPSEICALLDYKPSDKREAMKFREAAKWFIPIGLYTGMRLSEIADLTVQNLRCIEDIWCFDLSEYMGKTERASRIIPVHSKLITRGLLEYADELRKSKSTLLFPDLDTGARSVDRDGFGAPIGKWFNRTVLSKMGLDKKVERDSGLLVDFHCCRHTVASKFKYHGVDGYIAKQILGHDQSDEITWGVYAGQERTKLEVLKGVIEHLDY